MTLEEFLIELEKTPRGWEDIWGNFRLRQGGNRPNAHCPITAVCENMKLGKYSPDFYEEAAEVLDLNSALADKIVCAADELPKHNSTLRQRLREKIGL